MAEASRGVPARVVVWAFHLALPLAGLWLLLAVPAADVRIEHHPTHFWLIALAAALNVGLAVLVARAARRHDDARLLLVGLAFLAAALFLGLHALATPGVLLDSRNGGFALATPVGLALAALFTAASALDLPSAAVLRLAPGCAAGCWRSPRSGASSRSPGCRRWPTRRSPTRCPARSSPSRSPRCCSTASSPAATSSSTGAAAR